MFKNYLILILIILLSGYNKFVYAETMGEVNCVSNVCNQQENNNLKDLSEFKNTKAFVNTQIINKTPVYFIYRNGDSRYNLGYALGKAVLSYNPNYTKQLKDYLNQYYNQEGVFNITSIAKRMIKAIPCWLVDEMQGFVDAVNNNKDAKITLNDIVCLNTIILWSKLPKKRTPLPPVAPTSVTPINIPVKQNKLAYSLTNPNKMSDQSMIIYSINSNLAEGDNTFLVSGYFRESQNFFHLNTAVMVYNLDNTSFISVGFNGLFSILSAINDEGIVITTLNDVDQEKIEVMGATSPNVIARVSIEASRTLDECKEILTSMPSSNEQSYVIADKNKFDIIKTDNSKQKNINLFINKKLDKLLIYNFEDKNLSSITKEQLNNLKSENIKQDFSELKDLFSHQALFYTSKEFKDTKSSIFTVLFQPLIKTLWVLMPTNTLINDKYNYLEVNFNLAREIE